MAALGFETASGDFEVVDLCFAGLPDVYQPQDSSSSSEKGKAKAKNEESMPVDGKCRSPASDQKLTADEEDGENTKTWVAMVSGLSMGAQEAPADVKAEMLIEWLTGEAGGVHVSQTAWFSRPGC